MIVTTDIEVDLLQDVFLNAPGWTTYKLQLLEFPDLQFPQKPMGHCFKDKKVDIICVDWTNGVE